MYNPNKKGRRKEREKRKLASTPVHASVCATELGLF